VRLGETRLACVCMEPLFPFRPLPALRPLPGTLIPFLLPCLPDYPPACLPACLAVVGAQREVGNKKSVGLTSLAGPPRPVAG